MLFGHPPFYGNNYEEIKTKILTWNQHLEFPEDIDVSNNAIDLIKKLLCSPKNRLNDSNIKSHPFFEGIDWENLHNEVAPFVPQLYGELDHTYFDSYKDDLDKEVFSTMGKGYQRYLDDANNLFYGFPFCFHQIEDEKEEMKNNK